jgi:opacity protein-like surface antigen
MKSSRFFSLGILISIIILGISYGHPASAGFIVSVRGGYYIPQGWSDTHKLIYDGSGTISYGLETGYAFSFPLEVLVAVEFASADGHRVWPAEDGGWDVTDDAISYDLKTYSLIGRWRFLKGERVSPYLGGGLGFVQFDETGESAKDGQGFIIQGGSDLSVSRYFTIFVELEWSSFAGVIGNAGASRYYGEDNLGGLTARTGIRFSF